MASTLYDKLWDAHVVRKLSDQSTLIYIDRHIIHEVTSPQAFEGLRLKGRKPWRINSNIAVVDHNVPTTNDRLQTITDSIAREQLSTLDKNCDDLHILQFKLTDKRQGIVHIVGPEQGFTLPGSTIVCGDSHTSTHGAFATIAMGIGTSEVEHVLATSCLVQKKMKNMRIHVTGTLQLGVTAKDLILRIIANIGTAGGTGYAIEFSGPTIRALSMEARMTLCNMSIEAGARCGIIAFDETTKAYLKNRPYAPKESSFEKACTYWETLISDKDAVFDKEITLNVDELKPQVSWGTSPEMIIAIDEKVPSPADYTDKTKQEHIQRALDYMGLKPNQALNDIKLDRIFIGSCTNSRIEDLRAAAKIVEGKKIAKSLKQALVVPGSGLVKQQAELEGLDKIFTEAGFEWRNPGCSMCIAMNPDKLQPKEHCASTSNRNFEGRQGQGGRTHLVSPIMAAAAAIAGTFVDVREILKK